MKTFLIRHAEAIDYTTDFVKDDSNRFVTPKGRNKSREVFKLIKSEIIKIEKIFTSPLIRAVQTAEILANVIKFEFDIEVVGELMFETTPKRIFELLLKNKEFEQIALVGHEPILSQFANNVCEFGNRNINFRKSSICCIDLSVTDMNQGEFLWYFDSKKMEFVK